MNPNEIWQVDVNGQIYEASLAELTQWINDGSLLPGDRVRRGNLRWLDAIKVPALYGFFNARELGLAPPAIFSTTSTGAETNFPAPETIVTQVENFPSSSSTAPAVYNQTNASPNANVQTNFASQTDFAPIENFSASPDYAPAEFHSPVSQTPPVQAAPSNHQTGFAPSPLSADEPAANVCIIHSDTEPAFFCESCANLFCKSCPTSYGGTVKICPMCGAMCKPVAAVQQESRKNFQYEQDLAHGFGFEDFGRALAYPFKFKTSLVLGAIMFMLFTLGQSASGFGGITMIVAAIFCFMMSNMLTFGIMANTIDNMSQGKMNENFMPSFDDFNLWDDVIHPFFLSVGAYISSFGLVIAVVIIALFLTWKSTAAVQGEKIRHVSDQVQNVREEIRHAPGLGGNAYDEFGAQEESLSPEQQRALEDGDIAKMQQMMQEHRKAELESVVGKTPETRQRELAEMFKTLRLWAIPLLLLLVVGVLWGLFYLPAACAVAGYTRSFAATINPLVGLDTIKRMGFDYVKILLMLFIIAAASGIIGTILGLALAPFDMPGVGNLPATAVGSFFTFYFAVVFALVLGFAMYKNSAKLKLYR